VPLEFAECGVAVLVGDCTRCVGQVAHIVLGVLQVEL
jgi:hypothetical protein